MRNGATAAVDSDFAEASDSFVSPFRYKLPLCCPSARAHSSVSSVRPLSSRSPGAIASFLACSVVNVLTIGSAAVLVLEATARSTLIKIQILMNCCPGRTLANALSLSNALGALSLYQPSSTLLLKYYSSRSRPRVLRQKLPGRYDKLRPGCLRQFVGDPARDNDQST